MSEIYSTDYDIDYTVVPKKMRKAPLTLAGCKPGDICHVEGLGQIKVMAQRRTGWNSPDEPDLCGWTAFRPIKADGTLGEHDSAESDLEVTGWVQG